MLSKASLWSGGALQMLSSSVGAAAVGLISSCFTELLENHWFQYSVCITDGKRQLLNLLKLYSLVY